MNPSRLELRVPPLLLVLLAALAMYGTARLVPAPAVDTGWLGAAAVLVAAAGMVVMVLGVAEFRRAGTTVDPTRPAAASGVVCSGVYRFSRNPMYLGMALLLLAWGIWLGSGLALVWFPLFIAYMNRFQIEPEERVLLARFGAPFERYLQQVRRWL